MMFFASGTTLTWGAARERREAARLCGVVAWVVAFAGSVGQATEPGGVLRSHPEDMVGSLSCTSVSCHGGAESRQATNEVSGHSYVLWMGRDAKYRDGRRGYDPLAVIEKMDGDPHALAGQRILEPRFQEVLRRASVRADGTSDAGTYAKCAACHDPQAIHTTLTPALSQREREGTIEGIGCESCHGGGKKWLAEHYQRGVSRERLKQLGMIDTKDLQVRARLCAGCHVGSADQDMNHDMIAAGHPPLRFEQASYEALIGRKHWDDRPRRAVESEYEVQLWAAGRVAAAEAALELLESRANRSARKATEGVSYSAPWPEFAESNCFSCHQPLRYEVGRLPLAGMYKSESGVPAWQTWNTGLVDVVARGGGDSLSDAMKRLRTGMEKLQVPEAGEIAALSAEARKPLEGIQVERITHQAVLNGLAASREAATWDELCQKLAALAAVERSMRDGGTVGNDGVRERLRRIAEALKFRHGGIEWPVVFEDSSTMSLADVSRELEVVLRELQLAEETR